VGEDRHVNREALLILAAGQGTRIHEAHPNAKCLIPILGRAILTRTVERARRLGYQRIVVLTREEVDLPPEVGPIERRNVGSTRNMVETLMAAEDILREGAVVSYGDIVFSDTVLKKVRDSTHDVGVVVDRDWRTLFRRRSADVLDHAESLRVERGLLTSIGQPISSSDEPEGQYIGLIRFSPQGASAFTASYRRCLEEHGSSPWRHGRTVTDAYMTDFLQELIDQGQPLASIDISGDWFEFDTPQDLRLFESLPIHERMHLAGVPDQEGIVDSEVTNTTSAGGVLVSRDSGEWRVALVSDSDRREWRLPKGMAEPFETLEATAIREVAEETGYRGTVLARLPGADWINPFGQRWWHEHVHFFLLESSEPRGSRDQEHAVVEWWPIRQAHSRLFYECERMALRAGKAILDNRQGRGPSE
jgi:choline kinase/8-oxo-dGTP pyrophosphatase MutT (NUDIX family)